MSFNEVVEIGGVQYGKDAFGWIWAEYELSDGHHEWLKTPYESFEEIGD